MWSRAQRNRVRRGAGDMGMLMRLPVCSCLLSEWGLQGGHGLWMLSSMDGGAECVVEEGNPRSMWMMPASCIIPVCV